MKRFQISMDDESVDILEFFAKKEMKTSGTIRLALKHFYEDYVEERLSPGEPVVDPDGKDKSILSEVLAKPGDPEHPYGGQDVEVIPE